MVTFGMTKNFERTPVNGLSWMDSAGPNSSWQILRCTRVTCPIALVRPILFLGVFGRQLIVALWAQEESITASDVPVGVQRVLCFDCAHWAKNLAWTIFACVIARTTWKAKIFRRLRELLAIRDYYRRLKRTYTYKSPVQETKRRLTRTRTGDLYRRLIASSRLCSHRGSIAEFAVRERESFFPEFAELLPHNETLETTLEFLLRSDSPNIRGSIMQCASVVLVVASR